MIIDDKLLSHLFSLARIQEEKDPKKREKLIADLSRILEHFQELEEVNTSNVDPVSGGTLLMDVLRNDDEAVRDPEVRKRQGERGVGAFPESQNGSLKVPGVFE